MGLFEYRDFGLSGEDSDICIDLIEGFLGIPSVRGRDWIVPRLAGREMGNRRKDILTLSLAGFIRGSGPTPSERREDFLANLTAVMAIMAPNLTPGTLRLSDGYLGLPTGSEATITGRVRNGAGSRMENGQSVQLWTFEIECLEPDWEIGS